MNNRDWQRWFPEDNPETSNNTVAPGRPLSSFAPLFWTIGALLLVLMLAGSVRGIYTDWLWFSSLGYESVFATIISTRVIVFLVAALLFCFIMMVNVGLAARLTPKLTTYENLPGKLVQGFQKMLKWGVAGGTLLLAYMFGMAAQANWQLFLRFFNAHPFGVTDPVFNTDIAFYVFSLPLLQFVHGWLSAAMILALLVTGGVYFLSYRVQNIKLEFTGPVMVHLCALAVSVLALFALGYWLGIWDLVLSDSGIFFGAGYADLNARLPAQWIMTGLMGVLIAVVIVALVRRKYRWLMYGAGAWIVTAVLVGSVFPGMVQRLQVEPNELERERPYIANNIEATRDAFNLNRVDEQQYPAEDAPSAQDLSNNELTVKNIRLWDPRPLKDTYNQIQAIRLYYDFNDVDIDRYMIDDEYRQVMLSARELSVEKLDARAQTWVNRHLQFTHGYGLAMSPVNEISEEGMPVLWMQDIPPTGIFDIERPEIYFGEKTNHYVIVSTKTEEFDYPMGEENVYGHWEGRSGIDIGGFFNRLMYAWEFNEMNVLISGELTGDSQLLYRRNITERAGKLAPFLYLDEDPYLVVDEGRLFWIQDAYTATDRYPYSEPYKNGINYIRNSVKIVTDAYNGDITFYISDSSDPMILTYQSIFPELFASLDTLSPSLKEHLRYPNDMFEIQAAIYQSYHMRDVRVFYNKEDLWSIPIEIYGASERQMEPYFVIMRLPGEESEEFLQMMPFTPVNKNNAIGWLAARSDGENYGNLLSYHFPKEKLVYGPSQIENRIQQDTVITEQLALWSRGGSNVIRGNLLLIPLADSKIYVEPVFLQSESAGLPELKRVIVAIGESIAMEPTLRESIAALIGASPPPDTQPSGTSVQEPSMPLSEDVAELVEQAQSHFDLAQQSLKDGDWAGYGRQLDALSDVLQRLAQITSEGE